MPGTPAQLTPGRQADFANKVAEAIGADPRVIFAQEKSEGHPGDFQGYGGNFLNITATTARSLGYNVGSGIAGIAMFSDYGQAEQATIDEFKSRAIGITNESGKTAAEQIQDIANSPWAGGHYGTPPGSNLRATFVSLYGQAALGEAKGKKVITGGTESKPTLPNPIAPITDAIGSITDAFRFLFSYRFLEILGGGLLLLLGLYLLSRQLGVSVPKVGPVAKAADAVA